MDNDAEKCRPAENPAPLCNDLKEICFFPLFPVINYLSRLVRENFRSTLKQNGLYPGQEEILLTIMFNAGIKPQELANKLSTSLASISVSLKRLEKAGFIIKKPDEKDARTRHIYINETAAAALGRIHTELQSYESEIIKDFKNEELENLRNYLDRLIYNASGVENYSYKRPPEHERRCED
ncbi:MAG: MarR family transcriptional regulator [Clostridiales bacterium]|nr:MarR family transcriptional regulator [Clostridiales bacterium]